MKKPSARTSKIALRKTTPARATNLSKDFFQAIVNASPQLVFVFEGQGKDTGKIIAANSAASKRLGYSVSRLNRMNISDLDSPSSLISSTSLMTQLLTKKSVSVEIERRHKDGRSWQMDVQASVLKWQGRKLIVTFERDLSDRLSTDARLKLYEKELSKLEELDPLTELLNRDHFIDLAEKEFQRFKRYDRCFSLILADVDEFRSINEQFGNQIGDIVLKFLALQLASQMRKNDCIGRLGADEFGVLMPETDGLAALKIGERTRNACHQMTVETRMGDVKLTISMGVTQVTKDDPAFESVLKRAELAMRRAKEQGRDRVESA